MFKVVLYIIIVLIEYFLCIRAATIKLNMNITQSHSITLCTSWPSIVQFSCLLPTRLCPPTAGCNSAYLRAIYFSPLLPSSRLFHFFRPNHTMIFFCLPISFSLAMCPAHFHFWGLSKFCNIVHSCSFPYFFAWHWFSYFDFPFHISLCFSYFLCSCL